MRTTKFAVFFCCSFLIVTLCVHAFFLQEKANVQVHLGKTRAWNAAGEEPPGLVEAVPVAAHEPPCWTGNWALPPAQQGLIVLGSPLGSREFVVATLAERRSKHDELLARLPAMQDMQSAWLLLLLCAAPRCQYLLRTVPPSVTDTFATEHDSAVARCLAVLLSGGNEPMDLPALAQRRAALPLRMGGLGLASAAAHRHAAYWASWADTAVALREHHPGTLAELMRPMLAEEAPDVAPSAREAQQAAGQLRSLGLDVPTWAVLCEGAPPRAHPAQAAGPPARKGWQRYASASVDQRAFETLFSDLDPASRALLLSQGGDGASCALTALPTSADLVVPDAEYRVMLLRRLRLPVPLAPRRCRCGRALDTLGDHRTACAQVGVLAHRAGPLERAAARICREAGARVAASVALRDLNVDVPATDGRRIEVVANGLPLWRGAQIAVDTTLVSPLQRCGEPRPGADVEPGCALRHAEARKHRTYPELRAGGQGRCRLVVFGMEVGGRFSPNALAFIRRLARPRGRARAPWNAAAAGRALTRRWHCLASLAALRAHAQTLLELPVQSCDAGDDQELPLGELLAERPGQPDGEP